jgi:hypothetical protein
MRRGHDYRDLGADRRDDRSERVGRRADVAACCLASHLGAGRHRGEVQVHRRDGAGRQERAAGRAAQRAAGSRTGCCRPVAHAARAWAHRERGQAGDPPAGRQRCPHSLRGPPPERLASPTPPGPRVLGVARAEPAPQASGLRAWVTRSLRAPPPERPRWRRASPPGRAHSWPHHYPRPWPAWVRRGLLSAVGRRAPRRSRTRI